MLDAKIRKTLDHYRGRLACRIVLPDAAGSALFEFGFVDTDAGIEQSYDTDEDGVTIYNLDRTSKVRTTTYCGYDRVTIRVHEHLERGMRKPDGALVKAAGRAGAGTHSEPDQGKRKQKRDLQAIYRDASCSPYFRRNPKWCKGRHRSCVPYISYADVMGNEYAIRAAPSGFTPEPFHTGEDPVLVRYQSIDELVEVGWTLD